MRAVSGVLTAIFLLVMGPPVQAQNGGVGPLSALSGFPAWVRDVNGVQLQLCDVSGEMGAPVCPGLEGFDFARSDGDGDMLKAVYYSARAAVELDDNTFIEGVFFVEATDPGASGPAFVSNGILVRVRLPQPAAVDRFFSISSPWNDPATIRVGEGETKMEILLPFSVIAYGPDFTDVMTGPIRAFIGNGTASCAGDGLLGDGTTRAPLAARGPAGTDAFLVTEGAMGSASTNLFTVGGRLFAPAAQSAGGFYVERATVAEAGALNIGTLIASTSLGDGMRITGAGGMVFDVPIDMVPDGTGRFFANFPAGNLLAGPFPVMIDVSVTRNGVPVPALMGAQAAMTDLVAVRSASYGLRTRTLTVSAVSSISGSKAGPVVLTVTGSDAERNPVGNVNGTISGRSLVLTDIAVPPSYVTVTSSRGGRLTVPVTIR